jgi:O-antigen/teichoic acid export membrane protein
MIILSRLLQGSERSKNVKINIIALILLKGINVLIGLLLVPLTLNYLEPSKYGIWLTISSLVAWVGYFDLGLANGLRNKLGEALAKKDNDTSQVLVSTTFVTLCLIVLLLNIIFWSVNPFISWTKILNIDNSMSDEVNILVYVVFTFFSLQFLTGLISSILATDQKSALSNSFSVLASFLSLVAIYILTLKSKNSLILLGISLSSISFIVPLAASIFFFTFNYKDISPKISKVDFSKVKEIANQGVQFLFLQIASLILTMTDLLIISRLFGPEAVVSYNIAYRLFGFVLVLFSMFTSPFWAAYNEAYNNNDFDWVKRSTNKILRFWIIVFLGIIFLIVISNHIYKIWLGRHIIIPLTLSAFMGIYVLLQTLNSIFATFIFATGKLRLLTIISVFVAGINIPLCYLFATNFHFGTSGIILATIICTGINLIFASIQYNKLVNSKAKGIWDK